MFSYSVMNDKKRSTSTPPLPPLPTANSDMTTMPALDFDFEAAFDAIVAADPFSSSHLNLPHVAPVYNPSTPSADLISSLPSVVAHTPMLCPPSQAEPMWGTGSHSLLPQGHSFMRSLEGIDYSYDGMDPSAYMHPQKSFVDTLDLFSLDIDITTPMLTSLDQFTQEPFSACYEKVTPVVSSLKVGSDFESKSVVETAVEGVTAPEFVTVRSFGTKPAVQLTQVQRVSVCT